ncbi:MAG TPA: glycosyltransferase family 2 protein [Polyangiales bacterium]
MRLCIVIVNYKTPGLVMDALASLVGQLDATTDQVVVVDNASGDDSPERIEAGIASRGYAAWAKLIRSDRNGGFSAGNNVGIRSCQARYYLLLNSDTIVRPGAIATLLAQAEAHPEVGISGPRLEWPDGSAQISAFRDHTPVSELLAAAKTGPLSKLLRSYEVAADVTDQSVQAQWVSFACALIRREVIEAIGLLDEGYFMYFEDADYCRAARAAGFAIRYFPSAHVVHLRGGTSSVKRQVAARKRPPRYLYASRARYYRKGYGVSGLWAANLLWHAGRTLSLGRELVGHKAPHICEKEWRDNWTEAFRFFKS